MKFGSKKMVSKKDAIGRLRKTQLITTFASGALADIQGTPVIMAATDYWNENSPMIYEPSLQRLLGVTGFKEPYATESDSSKGNPDVPAFRFPKMYYCSKCHALKNGRDFGDPKMQKCRCGGNLIPSGFVAACRNGHLEDFPYRWWVHYGRESDCTEPGRWDQLTLEYKDSTSGLSGIVIRCKACGKERTMEDSMNVNALSGYRCRGKRPWIGMSSQNDSPDMCGAMMRGLRRSNSNVYFGIVESALTIPPWSQTLQMDINNTWSKIKKLCPTGCCDDAVLEDVVKETFGERLRSGRYSVSDYVKAIRERMEYTGRNSRNAEYAPYTEKKLLEEEYRALCAEHPGDPEETEPEQFVSIETKTADILEETVESVMLIKRLREVAAAIGFSRIQSVTLQPDSEYSIMEAENEFQPLWNQAQDWLPAVEMRGEGIFIRFKEECVRKWESANAARYRAMLSNREAEGISHGKLSPRYVFLHTFSHLMIRQLTQDCGYSGAALKERIYSTYPGSDFPMAGVLIYTSSSDSDGSLGGLVRQGESDLLDKTVRDMLEAAAWCSSDPLCSDSMAQGYQSLNYAACHACTLLPETSCEARNCLLDRVAVVGKEENRELGLLGKLVE